MPHSDRKHIFSVSHILWIQFVPIVNSLGSWRHSNGKTSKTLVSCCTETLPTDRLWLSGFQMLSKIVDRGETLKVDEHFHRRTFRQFIVEQRGLYTDVSVSGIKLKRTYRRGFSSLDINSKSQVEWCRLCVEHAHKIARRWKIPIVSVRKTAHWVVTSFTKPPDPTLSLFVVSSELLAKLISVNRGAAALGPVLNSMILAKTTTKMSN